MPESLKSPSISSTSSFDMVSSRSRSSTLSARSLRTDSGESEDEIIWSISSLSASGISAQSEDDFVVLGRGRVTDGVTPDNTNRAETPRSTDQLSDRMGRLSLSPADNKKKADPKVSRTPVQGKRNKNVTNDKASARSPSPISQASIKTSSPPASPSRSARKRRAHQAKKEQQTLIGLGSRPLVDDASDFGDASSVCTERSMYDDAVEYITSFLSSPAARDNASNLTFLQALIVELGLTTSSLPTSLTSARAMIKSQAFINVRDYLAVRAQGADAIKEVMYPSRSALVKSIKQDRKRAATLKSVKRNGLQVLLVQCYH